MTLLSLRRGFLVPVTWILVGSVSTLSVKYSRSDVPISGPGPRRLSFHFLFCGILTVRALSFSVSPAIYLKRLCGEVLRLCGVIERLSWIQPCQDPNMWVKLSWTHQTPLVVSWILPSCPCWPVEPNNCPGKTCISCYSTKLYSILKGWLF